MIDATATFLDEANNSSYRTNPPNQPKGFSTYYLDQLNLVRRQRLLKLICLSSAALIFLGGLYPLFMVSTTNNPVPYLLTLVSLAGAACFLTSYFLIRKPNSSLGRLKGVTAFVVSSALIEIFVSQFLNADTESFFALTFFTLIPVLAGVLGVSGRAIQLVTLSAFSSMIASFFIKLILYHPSGIGYTTLVNAVLNFMAIIVVTFIFVRQSVRSSQLSARQALELHKLVATLNTTNEVGVSLSHNLANVTSELSLTSHQGSVKSEAI